jgi:hypothetical protein
VVSEIINDLNFGVVKVSSSQGVHLEVRDGQGRVRLEKNFVLGAGRVGRYLKMCDRVHTDVRGHLILTVN